jgi:hypothetical protein
MEKQEKSPTPSARPQRLGEALTRLREAAQAEKPISQGSVVQNAAGRWMWTRKVAGKTVTVALSPEQARAFRKAIQANRRIETALARLRRESQTFLLNTLPSPRRKNPRKTTKMPLT